ncbi:hypothetical protein HID58_064452 [Brassica napus]|uniref:Uncharacterized protein n=1 Tax=Brassica napus TaxID=3708 RepID=A0ABQ7ZAD7_BRANA|nr:hypothetical protein HID58_064452 [Brassica napus]
MGLGLILDSTKDDEPDPYTRGYGGFVCLHLALMQHELDTERIKLQIWDTAGQERFRTITTDIRNWIRNIEQHASENVNKILVGNKADMDESKRAVPTSKGQALADEYGIKFFETSAKTNLNVEEVFFSIAKDIKQRLTDTDSRAEWMSIKLAGETRLPIFKPPNGGSGGHLDQPSHHSNVSRTGLIGESSHTYVSRTGFRRRSGAICGGGIEIQASHPIDLAPLPDEEMKKEKQKVEEEEQEEEDYGVT